MKNKILFPILISSLLLVGCSPKGKENYKFTMDINVPDIGAPYQLHGDLFYDIEEFVTSSVNKFDIDIAKFAFICNCGTLSLDKFDKPNTTTMPALAQLGFTNIDRVTLKADDYDTDLYDLTTVMMANKTFSVASKEYQLFPIAFLGTLTLEDNLSNFDIGVNNENYMLNETDHPEWKNKANHKGYDVASTRSIVKIDNYVKENKKEGATPIYLVTGHSRGGAIANLTSKVLTDRKEKVFGYTFASPTATDTKAKPEYMNIFNIIDSDDLVPELPPEEMGLSLYGTKKVVSMSENIETWNKYYPTVPFKHFDISKMSEVMKNVFISREFAYAVPSSEDYEVMVEFEKTQRAEALLEHRAYKEMFEEGTLAKKHTFVGDLVDIDEDTIGFAVKAAPIFIFDVVNMVIESPLTVIGNLGKIINFLKPYLLMILPVVPDLLNEDLIKNMLTPHNIEGYYPVLEVINSQK